MYDINHIIDRYKSEKDLEYLFFYGHKSNDSGIVNRNCLSQFYICDFFEDGILFMCAEQYMMYCKAMLFDDHITVQQILIETSPYKIKKLGRKVLGFVQNIWDENKFDIIVHANYLKFSQDLLLKEYLIKTHPKVLVETSLNDAIYGIGMKETDKNIENPLLWKGQNLLGFALMTIRDKLSGKSTFS